MIDPASSTNRIEPMARPTNRLSDTQLKRTKLKPGMHADGAGLYLRVQNHKRSRTQSRSFVFVYFLRGKRREAGLGAYPSINLATARDQADHFRQLVAKGLDPIAERKRQTAPTMLELATEFIATHKHTWAPRTLDRYNGYATNQLRPINTSPSSDIETADVLTLLKTTLDPQTQSPTPTTNYVRSFIERCLDYATILGHRSDIVPNPARYRGHIQLLLPKSTKPTKHRPSLPYAQVPAFAAKLIDLNTPASLAFALTILTATRQSEIRLMRWRELTTDNTDPNNPTTILTIPAERSKTKTTFRIPLSKQARTLIDSLRPNHPDAAPDPDAYVFQTKSKPLPKPLHRMSFFLLCDKLDLQATPHGFRTSFREWGGKHPIHRLSPELLERCLNHVVGGKVRRAYDRDDYLDQRAPILQAWADFVSPPIPTV